MLKTNTAQMKLQPTDPSSLADDQVGYVTSLRSEDLPALVPDAPAVQPGVTLWALVNGNGHPVLITDSRDAAFAGAVKNDMTMVSLH